MSVLLLRLAGPMQSWGIQSRFSQRDTGQEPSKSGVVGLLCAACGMERNDESKINELASLKMGVRVEREGRLRRDFQTAGGGRWPGSNKYGVHRANGATPGTVTSERYYLSDAYFLVGMEGPRNLLKQLDRALRNPVRPLFLGRKSYVPSEPIWMPNGVIEGAVDEVLRSHPYKRILGREVEFALRLVLECPPGEGRPRPDQPISFGPNRRRYTLRYVHSTWIDIRDLPVVEEWL